MGLMNKCMPIMGFAGKMVVKKILNKTLDPMAEQKKLLKGLIEESKDTEYGKEHHFSEIHSIEDYQNRVPLNEYDNLYPYIKKMADGEQNILTKKKIVHFNRTSGTLGVPKKIPVSEEHISIFGKYNAMYLNGLVARDFGYAPLKGKGFSLTEGTYEILPSGIPYGCASSIMAAKMDKLGIFKGAMDSLYTSPSEAVRPKSGSVTRYIHARFALMEKNVTYGVSTFSSNFLEILRYIERNWKILVNDIKNGTIDEISGLDDDVKESLLKKIKPMPKRAKELEQVFANGFDEPFVPKIWPKFSYYLGVCGANFSQYTEKLKKLYLGQNVRLIYLGLTASEAYISTQLYADKEDSLLVCDAGFFEFRNTNEEKSQDYVTMDKLKVGESYEVVVTNLSGLYRYRIHDVVRVTGMYNNTPTVVFENRAGFAVNMFGEKTSEKALLATVKNTEKRLGLDIVDYSVYPDVDSNPSGYVYLIEVNEMPKGVTKEMIRKVMQEELGNANPSLKSKFEMNTASPLRLYILQKETYLLYRDLMVMKGVSSAQLKPVNVIRNELQRKFFFSLEDKEIE